MDFIYVISKIVWSSEIETNLGKLDKIGKASIFHRRIFLYFSLFSNVSCAAADVVRGALFENRFIFENSSYYVARAPVRSL
jgi:hypothetical protein